MARFPSVVTSVLGVLILTTQGGRPAFALRGLSRVDKHILTLGTRGVGPVLFGTPEAGTVRKLQGFLDIPNARGINTGCGRGYTEVAWHDFIAEFRRGHFTGYRYISGGYPGHTSGSPRDRVAAAKSVPLLATALGITLGGNLAELRRRYRRLKQSGAASWTVPSGMTFVVSSKDQNEAAGSDRIVEIKIGVCGAF